MESRPVVRRWVAVAAVAAVVAGLQVVTAPACGGVAAVDVGDGDVGRDKPGRCEVG